MKLPVLILFILLEICSGCGGDDYYNLGIFYAKQGNYEKAIDYFGRAIAQNPKDHDAYYNRGYYEQLSGALPEAIKDYTISISLKPTDFDAYNNRGQAKAHLEQKPEAMEDYRKAIELNPNYASVYFNLGNVYFTELNFDSAYSNWKIAEKLGHIDKDGEIKKYCK